MSLFVVVGLVACDDGNEDKGNGKGNNEPQSVENEPENDAVNEPEELAENDEPEAEDVPREYGNALRSAQNYVDIMAFSEKGLFEQLTSEYGDQYPEDAAQYAIDNLDIDYNEQALKAAENYLEIMPMSDQELLDQLTSEYGDKYTAEQAQYAIDNLAD